MFVVGTLQSEKVTFFQAAFDAFKAALDFSGPLKSSDLSTGH
jgi:hypothetical protein